MIPLTVPKNMHKTYQENYTTLTRSTNRFLFFTSDHQHLNTSLEIPEVANNPAHLFEIASKAPIGAFGAHLGLIARYAGPHANTPLIVSLTGDTYLGKENAHSYALTSVDEVVAFAQETQRTIVGIHCTIYPGSEHEGAMLYTATQAITRAHQHGLLAIVSMQPDSVYVHTPNDSRTLSCAASAATSLGADFVILHPQHNDNPGEQAQTLRAAVLAAGNTGVLASGGASMSQDQFITQVNAQLSIAGTRGIAVGRNIYQRSVDEAVALCQSLSNLIYGKK